MAVITAPADATRRHALLIGTAQYKPGWADIGKGVNEELRQLQRLLGATLRYDTCQEVRDRSADELATSVVEWIRSPDIREDDLAVVYYTGHGVAQGSQLRLIMPGTPPSAPNTAPSAADLANWIWGNPEGLRCRHVLVIIDTCNSGGGTSNALQIANDIREAAGGQARGGEFHVVAAARSIEQATVGRFVDTLDRVIDSGQAASPDEEWVRPDALIDRINADPGFRSGPQHADITGRGEGAFRFFPNPRWDPTLRVPMEREQRQRALRRLQELAERTHWNPRERGVAVQAEQGTFFVGRTRALDDLGAWAQSAAGGAARLVVGRPGCGKSALLARFAGAERQPAVDLAIHARAKTANGVLLELAFGLDLAIPTTTTDDDLPTAVLEALSRRKTRALVVIDALDEADDPEEVALTLRFLIDGAPPLALVVGVRRGDQQLARLARQLGTRAVTLGLDSDEYWDSHDVEEYARHYLAQAEGSPYQGDHRKDERAAIAAAVAKRAGRSFLVASATVHTLVRSGSPIGEGELDSLPSNVGEAFDQDLRRFPAAARPRGRAMLSALAFAEGRGLPRALWLTVAEALGNVVVVDADLDYWLDAADFFIVADEEAGSRVYRLYHDEFARHLRVVPQDHGGGPAADDRAGLVALALARAVGDAPADWFSADPYLQQYLCVHAAGARLLDQYTDDPGFLAGSDPTRLLNALRRARTGSSGNVEQSFRLLRLAYQHLRGARPSDRSSQLQVAARQLGNDDLADRFAATLDLPWQALWTQMPADLSLTLARLGSTTDVDAIAIASLDGELVIAAGEYSSIRLWELASGLERPPLNHTGYIRSLVTLEVGDGVLLIAGDSEGEITCWDLRTGTVQHSTKFGELGTVHVAAGSIDGEPVVVAAQSDALLLWRLNEGSVVRDHRSTRNQASIRSVAIASQPAARVLVGRDDGVIEVRDVRTLDEAEPLFGHRGRVTSILTAVHEGASVAVSVSTGGDDSSLRLWDLATRRQLARVMVPSSTNAVAFFSSADGTACVATAGDDLAVWHLTDGSLVGRLQGHEGPARSLVTATIDGSLQLVTGGVDGTIRQWDPRDASTSLTEPDPTSAFSAVSVGRVAGKDILVSARGLGRFELRDPATGAVSSALPCVYPRWTFAMAVAEVGNTLCLVFSGEDEYVRRIDLRSQALIDPPLKAAPRREHALHRPIFEFALIESGGAPTVLSAAGQEPQVWQVDLASGRQIGKPWILPDEVRAIAAAGESVVLMTHKQIFVADLRQSATGVFAPRRELQPPASGWSAIATAMAGEELLIFGGGWDRAVSLMDANGGLISSLKLDTVINALALDASGSLIVVGNKGLMALRCRALAGGVPVQVTA